MSPSSPALPASTCTLPDSRESQFYSDLTLPNWKVNELNLSEQVRSYEALQDFGPETLLKPQVTAFVDTTLEVRNDAKRRINEIANDHPFIKSLVAGSVSGACSSILFQPFDLVKTRMQNASTLSAQKTRMVPLFAQVVRDESIIGLWRGTIPSLMRCVPGVGLYFASLNWIQVQFYRSDQKGSKRSHSSASPSALEAVCMGVTARAIAGSLLIPVTVVKTRYESGLFIYKSLYDALKVTYVKEGLRGLSIGLAPTLLRDAPFSGLYYMFYSQLKNILVTLPSTSHSSLTPSHPVATFSCGLTAGLLASVVTHPADVVKTKMQLHPREYPNLMTTIFVIVKQQGTSGFFRGLAPRMLRRTLMATMAWTVYESMMKNFGLK